MTVQFEEEICPICRGSGEGMTERCNCYYCNGTGCVMVEFDDDKDDEDDQDE
jgi:RecJ-like exonuclease